MPASACGTRTAQAIAGTALSLSLCVPSPGRAGVPDADCPGGAQQAAVAAVRQVFGADAEVTLTDVSCERARSGIPVDVAVAEPGSRTEGPVRFVLYATGSPDRRRVGRLTSVVRVSAPHVRTVVPVVARTPLGRALVAAQTGPIGRVRFGSLVVEADVVGKHLRRNLPADAVLTRSVVEHAAMVRSGVDVVTRARVQGVEVLGRAVAAQDGDLGDLVIVVNPDSRKRLRGRVVADSLVEVLDVS